MSSYSSKPFLSLYKICSVPKVARCCGCHKAIKLKIEKEKNDDKQTYDLQNTVLRIRDNEVLKYNILNQEK